MKGGVYELRDGYEDKMNRRYHNAVVPKRT